MTFTKTVIMPYAMSDSILTFLSMFWQCITTELVSFKILLNGKCRMVVVEELGKGWYLERKVDKKGKENWVLRLNLPKGYPPSFKEVAEWLCMIAAIEEKKYPQSEGYKGRNYPREFIECAMKSGWPTPSVLNKFRLKIE